MAILISILPILTLIVCMMGFKMSGDRSALSALGLTILLGLFAAPGLGFAPEGFTRAHVGWAVCEGVIKAVFPILLIIMMAIFSYNVLLASEQIEVIKRQISSISNDPRISVLLIVWGFGGILEGMAGFGTAVAIPAAILISLGFKPGFLALVSLLANSVATGFGAVGVPVITLASEVGQIENIQEISSNVVLQLSPLMYILPFLILTLTDRSTKALAGNLLLTAIVGTVSLGVQYAAARYLGAETPAILGSLAAIAAIIAYAKVTEAMKGKQAANDGEDKPRFTLSETLKAWSVYGLILVFIILMSPLSGPIGQWMKSVLVTKIHLPIYPDGKFFKFAWISNAALMLFLGAFLGGLIQGLSANQLLSVLGKTLLNLKKTSITIISLISLSSIMTYSGMIVVIAEGLAEATGPMYGLFAPLIGAIGTFVTGSDTSSNILFGKLQANVAQNINMPTSWLAAANTAGATGGKIISPQSIAIATASCGTEGTEGKILRSALPYSIGYVLIAGLMVYFMV
ncbi:MAG: lactate permease [Bacteroidetes bacterium]|nr:MAG: lactate permease [Bacteroidota bacterium]